MTVQELIDQLQQCADKTLPVRIETLSHHLLLEHIEVYPPIQPVGMDVKYLLLRL